MRAKQAEPQAQARGDFALPASTHRAARQALLSKERRELRPALYVGLLLFVALPLLWTALFAAVDPKSEILPGFTIFTALGGGWLFAAVVAAQTVCRDFGRASGQFLTGLPVTPAEIVRAKARASFVVLLGIIAAAAVTEFAILGMSFDSKKDVTIAIWTYGAMAVLAAVFAFWIAFAAAALTRQTLPGVMIAGLALVLLIALPMVSSVAANAMSKLEDFWRVSPYGRQSASTPWGVRDLWHKPILSWFLPIPETSGRWPNRYPSYALYQGYYGMIDVAVALMITLMFMSLAAVLIRAHRTRLPLRFSLVRVLLTVGFFVLLVYSLQNTDPFPLAFLAIVLILAALCRIAATVALRSERGLRFGTKAVAWSIAGVTLLAFTLAMREVGANLPIAATVWHGDNGTKLAVSENRLLLFGTAGARIYDLKDTGGAELLVAHPTQLAQSGPHVTLISANGNSYLANVWIDRSQELVRTLDRMPRRSGSLIMLFRLDSGRADLSEPSEVFIPPDPDEIGSLEAVLDAASDRDTIWMLLLASQWKPDHPDEIGRLILVRYRHQSDPLDKVGNAILSGYGEPAAKPEIVQPLDHSTTPIDLGFILQRIANPELYGRTGLFFFQCGADERLYLAGSGVAPIATFDPTAIRSYYQQDDMTFANWGAQLFPVAPDIAASANRAGLALIRSGVIPRGGTWADALPGKLLGVARASPLSWAFRSPNPSLHYAGPNKLWEIHDTSAICYDVSDPTRPRRIAHVNAPRIQSAVSGPRFLILDHGAGFSVVKHP